VVLGAAAIVVVAVITGRVTDGGPNASTAPPASLVARSAEPSLDAGSAAAAAVPEWSVAQTLAREQALDAAARPLPAALWCHALDPSTCRTVARAALDVLPSGTPRVKAVSAWPTLLCGDSLDCPSTYLAHADPVGSAVVDFADGSRSAWINVARRVIGAKRVADVVSLEAWIIR
jgi:hypothetical protein